MADIGITRLMRRLLPASSAALLAWGVPLAVLLVAVAGSHIVGRPVADFTRDPAAVASIPPYIGMVSHAGVLLWWSAGTLALAAGLLRLIAGIRDAPAAFLVLLGGLTLTMAADDIFMLHEAVFPRFLKLPEQALLVPYAVLLAYLLIRFRALYWQQNLFFLASALGSMGLSVVIDQIPESLIGTPYPLEDGFKLIGIANWLAFVIQLTLPYVRPARH